MQPEASPELPAPAAARHELGTYLRAQRVRRRINIARAAAHVGIAPGTLSRIETAYAPIRTAYLYLLLDLYRITDDTRRRELADLARQGQCQPYWAEHDDLIPEGTAHYLALEASAAVIRTYAPQLIPYQLMTAGYAVVAARATRPDLGRRREDKVAALARARCDQITRSQCRVHALINMSALHRITDPADVAAQQFSHLCEVAANPAITIRLIPDRNPPLVISPPFTLLTLPGQPHDAGCCHGPAGQVTVTRRVAAARAMNATWEELVRDALTAEVSAGFLAELAET